jgi:hypothetical protein
MNNHVPSDHKVCQLGSISLDPCYVTFCQVCDDIDFSQIDFLANLANGLYDQGIALVLGKTLSGLHYSSALDFDGCIPKDILKAAGKIQGMHVHTSTDD